MKTSKGLKSMWISAFISLFPYGIAFFPDTFPVPGKNYSSYRKAKENIMKSGNTFCPQRENFL